ALAGGVDEVVVVLGHDADRVREALRLPDRARAVVNPRFEAGQSSSLQAGLEATAPDSEAAVILLADQPGVSPDTIRAVLDAFRQKGARIVRASHGSRPAHPVLLSRDTWGKVAALEGDVGAREVIAAHPDWVLDVDAAGVAPPDVDTPEDYERLLRHPDAKPRPSG
nr:nucleotidyltransferase family protein [Actinomycetota bacterium]